MPLGASASPGCPPVVSPLNYLLGELGELAAANPFPAAFTAVLAVPRRCLDALLDRGGWFDPDAITQRQTWLAWLAHAVAAILAAAPPRPPTTTPDHDSALATPAPAKNNPLDF